MMKKFISAGMATVLLLPLTTTTVKAQNTVIADLSPPTTFTVKPSVQSDVYATSAIQQDTVYTSVYQAVYSPDQLNITTPYGIAYHNKELYIAKSREGLAKASLVTGKVITIFNDSRIDFQTVAIDSQGNLYYTVRRDGQDLDIYIKKISYKALQNLPLTSEQLAAESTVYARYTASTTSEQPQITSMVFDSRNRLYISLNSSSLIDGTGVMRWDNETRTFNSVITNQSSGISGIGIDASDNLYFKPVPFHNDKRFPSNGINRIPASALQTIPVSNNMIESYHYETSLAPAQSLPGIIFLPDGTSYASDRYQIKRIFPNGLPIITLNGEANVTVRYGETYEDAGAFVEDEKYTGLNISTTYTLNGTTVDHIDLKKAGTYTVHYNAVNPDKLAAKEVIRTVIIKARPASLNELEFSNPVSMDYANGTVYVANPATSTSTEGGIYKVSIADYKPVLVATLPKVQAVAMNQTGDLYFSLTDQPNSFYKLEATYLQTDTPLTQAEVMTTAKQITPFSSEQLSGGTLSVKGLDFDAAGRLYIATGQGNISFWPHAVIFRSTDNSLQNFLPFLEGDSQLKHEMVGIQDIEISPGGNLYAQFQGSGFGGTFKLPSTVLVEVQPTITEQQFQYVESRSSNNTGIVFLADGQGFVSNLDYPQAVIGKMFVSDPAPAAPPVVDAYRLENLNIPTPNGMAYFKESAYIAQQNNGISKVDLNTRTVTQLVYGSTKFPIRAIAIDSKGALYYPVINAKNPEYTYIKKVDATVLKQSITAEQLVAKSINYAYLPVKGISGLAMDASNRLYVSIDNQKLDGYGLMRWNTTSKLLEPVIEETEGINGIGFDTSGNLYFKANLWSEYYDFAIGTNKIPAAALKGKFPISSDKIQPYKSDQLLQKDTLGLLFLPDGKSYHSNGSSLKRIFPDSRPIIKLNGHTQVTTYVGDTYPDPGVFIEDEKDIDLHATVTYSFEGKSVSQLDTNKTGIYTIHYNVVNAAGIPAIEKTRQLTIQLAPPQLTDWYMIGIQAMDANKENLYITSTPLTNDPNYGLYQISLKDNQKTKLAATNDVTALAVQANGDLFFTRSGMSNMIFKVDAKYLQSGKTLTASELMQSSRTYMPFVSQSSDLASGSITGMAFDPQGRLYVSHRSKNNDQSIYKVFRLSGVNLDKLTLITATTKESIYDLAFNPAGDLYMNTISTKPITYKINAQQLKSLPVQTPSFSTLPNHAGDFGIVILSDGQGYVSDLIDFYMNKQTIWKLKEN
ncbi:immunoglobulin-like domain-containing protein [Paenibacillus sp. WLX2291]|uniref:immunoglobulin-like domain-containing protein n=1 Tax=Paenibacillus sp. WLX2291 TaxID=3296934 RepID=UPI0039844235